LYNDYLIIELFDYYYSNYSFYI